MNTNLILYHGSQQIVEVPKFGIGKSYNDYGQGFYCTESIELAKEWACQIQNDGYANKYVLHLNGLNVMHLTKGEFNILNWLAILLTHRKFDISSSIGRNAREYILSHFMPDTENVDVMIGYRADDSYFSFAEDFVNNTISLRDLNVAMQLETLGEQVVLLSEKSFKQIEFLEYEIAAQIASSSWTPSGRKLGLPQPLRLRKQCQGMLQRVLLECSTPDSSSEGC